MYLVRNFRNGHTIGIVFKRDGTMKLLCGKGPKATPKGICEDCQTGLSVALGTLLQQSHALNEDGRPLKTL